MDVAVGKARRSRAALAMIAMEEQEQEQEEEQCRERATENRVYIYVCMYILHFVCMSRLCGGLFFCEQSGTGDFGTQKRLGLPLFFAV